MNKVILMGRLVRDPEVRYSQEYEEPLAIARFTMAVDRKTQKGKEGQGADFIKCIAFGKGGEFAERYLRKGTKIVIAGRIQTGSYTNKNGEKVYTTDVVVEEFDFAESKGASSTDSNNGNQSADATEINSFMDIPDGAGLPFH